MSLVVEVLCVWLPIAGAVVFVAWFAGKCFREGLGVLQVLLDRRFMTVFLYTGALLAIYLSTFYFFYRGFHPPPEP